MYKTLVMLKPEAAFAPEELRPIVTDVVSSGDAVVSAVGSTVRITSGAAWIEIVWDSAVHVIAESGEIADRYSIPCRGCRGRFVMCGDDPDMDLFNDYLLINERLQATGKFVIFDSQECKLLFEPRG